MNAPTAVSENVLRGSTFPVLRVTSPRQIADMGRLRFYCSSVVYLGYGCESSIEHGNKISGLSRHEIGTYSKTSSMETVFIRSLTYLGACLTWLSLPVSDDLILAVVDASMFVKWLLWW